MIETLTAQLVDPFRIVLLVGLFITMWRTRAATGVILPLALGAAFVAVLIPLTINPVPLGDTPYHALVGLVANGIWLLVIAAAWSLARRVTGR